MTTLSVAEKKAFKAKIIQQIALFNFKMLDPRIEKVSWVPDEPFMLMKVRDPRFDEPLYFEIRIRENI